MAKLKFKNPKTGLWEEVSGSLQNLKDGEKASLYMDNTNEVTTPAGGTTLHPNPVSSTTSPTATGTGSFAIGSGTKATGDVSVAEGILNEASGKASHAEGAGTKAGGNTSHAEGFYTEATGDYSHAGNYGTIASGKKSHAEGGQTKAIGDCTHAEGDSTTAQGTGSHAEGAYTFANGEYSHAEGCGNNFEGADQKLIAGGTGAHAEGFITKAMGDYSHAEGMDTKTSGQAAHAEGFNTTAINKSHAEGEDTLAGGDAADNRAAHAEGLRTTATGAGSHAEGSDTIASGRYSHAEGRKSTTGEIKTTASGEASHAEGVGTTASGYNSHSEGGITTASGMHSHAEGYGTTASGKASHAGGTSTIAQWDNSTVVGQFNKTSNLSNTSSDPLFIVGNGTSTSARKNALEVFTDGTAYVNGKKILVEGDAGGGGGVTANGNNTFTGRNTFTKPTNFEGITVSSFNLGESITFYENKADFLAAKVTIAEPTADNNPATKKYVDDHAGGGGTQITSVSADAITLSYYESATANVNFTNGNMHFTFGIPQGEPYENPCLIEGTPINMADGTTKLIENIKQGDLVQSYNPVTGENTPAVVLLAYITGHEHKFTSYSFSNGKHLTIYGMHGIYNKRTGITKDIRNINKNDQIVSISGDTVQWITSSEFMIVGEKKARYNIVTSNNLYYANGILLGQKPFSKMQLVNDFNIPLSDEIRKVWQQDVDDYNSYSSFLNDPNYHAEVAEAYNKLTKAEHHIKVNKQRLLDSDYWVQKFTEGLLSLTEWAEAKAKRAAWRKEVNDNEVLRDESKAAVDAIINKYRNGKTPKSIFESCCARDNGIYEICKNYFDN